MEKGPQYISSIWKRVHNTLVQYGKVSTIDLRSPFNTMKRARPPQYPILSPTTPPERPPRPPIHSQNMEKGPQYISSIWKRVYNISIQYRKGSTIHQFNTEKGPQYISSIQKCPQYISSIKRSTIYKFNMEKGPQYISSIWKWSTI